MEGRAVAVTDEAEATATGVGPCSEEVEEVEGATFAAEEEGGATTAAKERGGAAEEMGGAAEKEVGATTAAWEVASKDRDEVESCEIERPASAGVLERDLVLLKGTSSSEPSDTAGPPADVTATASDKPRLEVNILSAISVSIACSLAPTVPAFIAAESSSIV